MGAATFSVTTGGKGVTAKEAYARLVEQALYEHGHDPYNGSISTTSGFVVVELGRRRMRNVIEEILNDDTSEIRKWGPAGCIELKGRELTEWRRRSGLSKTRARAFCFFGWAAE